MTVNMLPIYVPTTFKVTQEQFTQIALTNRELRLERTGTGELIIMPPTGGNTGRRNLNLGYQLYRWNEQTQLGIVFDSSTAFVLPNSSIRSPDIAWISQEKWNALTPEEQDGFPPFCPEFVIELRSKTDAMKPLQEKMQEYLQNGLKLGWLIDPSTKTVEIYRPNQPVEILANPSYLTGEEILPDFILELQFIFT
jgi:Uma2 family endonuclease